jgi:hypothetical protein
MNLQLLKLIILGVGLGLAVGVGVYTFWYGKGYSYMSNDPNACANCHIMNDQYSGWLKSSHRSVATCNDCHTPHNFVIYAIYYTGVIGLLVFCCMIMSVFAASYYIPDPSVRLLQMSHVAMMCMVALVGNMFETPIAAGPFYLISGVCLGLEAGMPKRYV